MFKKVSVIILCAAMIMNNTIIALATENDARVAVSYEIAGDKYSDEMVGECAGHEIEEGTISYPEIVELSDEKSKDVPSTEEVTSIEVDDVCEELSIESTYALTYSVNDDGKTATITGFSGTASGDLIIPSTINGYKVVEIKSHAFYQESEFDGKLVLPNGLITIGGNAFDSCSGLKGELVIPSTVKTIGYGAFRYCNFTGDLIIPDSVNSVGLDAFSNGDYDGELHISNSMTVIEGGTFSGCSRLKGTLVIPNGITKIGLGAFWGCRGFSGTLFFPGSVKEIEDKAFISCYGFEKLNLNKVEIVGNLAFSGCEGLNEIRMLKSVETMGQRAFESCTGLKSLDLTDVKKISNYEFSGCTGLTGELVIPEEMEEIGQFAFEDTNYNSITILANNLYLRGYAFYNCTSLSGKLTIPAGIKGSAWGYDFAGCTGLSNVHISEGANLGKYSFRNCTGLRNAYIDKGSSFYSDIFSDCTNLGKVVNYSGKYLSLPKVDGVVWRNAETDEVITKIYNGIAVRLDYDGKCHIKVISHENGKVSPTILPTTGDCTNQDTSKTNIFEFEVDEEGIFELTISPDEGYQVFEIAKNGIEIDTTKYYDKNGAIFYRINDVDEDLILEIWYFEFMNEDLFIKNSFSLGGNGQYYLYEDILTDISELVSEYDQKKSNDGEMKWLLKNLGYKELKIIIEHWCGYNWTNNEISDGITKKLLLEMSTDEKVVGLVKSWIDKANSYNKRVGKIKNMLLAGVDSEAERKNFEELLEAAYEFSPDYGVDIGEVYVGIEKSSEFNAIKKVFKAVGVTIDVADILALTVEEFYLDQEIVNILYEYTSEEGALHKGLARHNYALFENSNPIFYAAIKLMVKMIDKHVEKQIVDLLITRFAEWCAYSGYQYGIGGYSGSPTAIMLVKIVSSALADTISTPEYTTIIEAIFACDTAGETITALRNERTEIAMSNNLATKSDVEQKIQIYKDRILYEACLVALDLAYESLSPLYGDMDDEMKAKYNEISQKYNKYKGLLTYEKNLAYCRANYVYLGGDIEIQSDDEIYLQEYENGEELRNIVISNPYTSFILETPQKYNGRRIVALGNNLYANNNLIEGAIVTNNITRIGNNCFENCENLWYLLLSDSLETIGEKAFYGCGKIEEVDIPVSVIRIGDNAFPDGIIIKGERGSYAEIYARQNGYKFVSREKKVASIDIKTLPLKNEFGVDEPIDLQGLELLVCYGDGTSEVINEGYYLGSPSVIDFGKNIYQVYYKGCVADVEIEIIESPCTYTISYEDIHHNKIADKYVGNAKVGDCLKLYPINIRGYIPIQDYMDVTLSLNNDFTFIYEDGGVFTVTFDSQGGTIVEPISDILAGDTVKLPTSSKERVSFLGWYTEPDGKGTQYTDDTPITEDITLYAKWGIGRHTVVFDPQGGSLVDPWDTIEVVDGESEWWIFNPEREGFYFLGWFTEPDGNGTRYFSSAQVKKDLILYAYWVKLEESDNFQYYELKDGTLCIVGKTNNTTGDLIIPSVLDGKKVTRIESDAFHSNYEYIGKLILPNSLTYIGDYAFAGCDFVGELILPNKLTYIGWGAFYYCNGFTGDLSIPNGVTSIGEHAFGGCSGFTGDLSIPNSVTSIGQGAFEGCSSLTGSLKIPNSVTSIGEYAFGGCSGFKGELKLPSNISHISDGAFEDCSGLTGELVIPNNVTSIGKGAFAGCSGFVGGLTIPNSVTSIGKSAFAGCSSLTGSLKIPINLTNIEQRVFQNCQGLTGDLTIPPNVTSIGGEAFWRCSGFTGELVIPSSVTSIGREAFWGCSGFTGDLTIPSNVTEIGENAFEGCSGLDGTVTFSSVLNVYYAWSIIAKCINIKKVVNNTSYEVELPIIARKGWRNSDTKEKIKTVANGTAIRYDLPQYTITFDSQGGSYIQPIEGVYEGDCIYEWPNPSGEGMIFSGWYTEPFGKGTKVGRYTKIHENITVYAFWKYGDGIHVAGLNSSYLYSGNAIKPIVKVYENNKELILNKDYTYTIKNNTNAGTATITVRGKGNYDSVETVDFEILKRDISSNEFIADEIVLKATGRDQKPKPIFKWNGKVVPVTGYKYTYYNADEEGNPTGDILTAIKEAGDYVLVITGEGNFTGTRNVKVKVSNDVKDASNLKVAKIPNQSYTGESITPKLTVYDGINPLTAGIDYLVTYANNINVGGASVIVTGIGNYVGTKRVAFNITGTPINKATVDNFPKSVIYKGTDYTVDDFDNLKLYIAATSNKVQCNLTEGVDYSVSYSNNKEVGTATVVFTGINGYTGVLKKTFKITQYKFAEDAEGRINVDVEPSIEYSKGGAKPKVVVTFRNSSGLTDTLVEVKDYTLAYTNNTSVNDGSNAKRLPTVKVTFKGNYLGTTSANFIITAKDISKTVAAATDKTYANRGGAYKSAVVLTDSDGKNLTVNKDYDANVIYTIKGSDAPLDEKTVVDADTIVVATVKAKEGGNYSGSTTCEYRVVQAVISSAKIKVESKIYTGNEIVVNPETDITSAKIGTKTNLIYGTDYEIVPGSYADNIKKGTASFVIRGINNYGGTKKVTFTIKAKGFIWWWRNILQQEY